MTFQGALLDLLWLYSADRFVKTVSHRESGAGAKMFICVKKRKSIVFHSFYYNKDYLEACRRLWQHFLHLDIAKCPKFELFLE